jgi:peptidoglycan/LPS O-acetylase OafA/YrhL
LKKWHKAAPYIFLVAGIAIFVARPTTVHTLPFRLLPVAGFALSCLGLLLLGFTAKVPRIRADWSLGIYLYHFPLLSHGLICFLPILCWVSYRFIEKPALSLKNWSPKWPTGRSSPEMTAGPAESASSQAR